MVHFEQQEETETMGHLSPMEPRVAALALQEEEKKDVEEDWHASVRGPSISVSAQEETQTQKKKKKKKRNNRGSLGLDGTRRFRKVVTFRNSLVQTREIAGRRRRGRNSLLPWFSSNAQEHTQEVLEEQERQRQEKAAKKQAKKEEKAAKKAEKQAKKEQKKAAKKAKKDAKKHDLNQSQQSLQDNNNEMDMSLSVRDIMGESMGDANASAQLEDSFAVDHSRRRRSSISTAILDTMKLFSNKKPRPRFPKNSPRMDPDNSQSSSQARKQGDYDWSTHLRSAQAKGSSKKTSPQQEQSNATTTATTGMQKQKSQQDLIEEEEDAYEQGLQALPRTNPPTLNDSTPDLNSSFAQTTNPNASAIFGNSMNSSLDISGESFADPNSVDAPKNPPRRGRRKFGGVFGSTNRKSSPKRKPTPGRLTSIKEVRHDRSDSMGSSISGPLANVVASSEGR